METANITDREILSLIDQGGRSAERGFALLIDSCQEKIYWHIRRMVHYHHDADDVLQNTFVKVFRNISKFKGQSALSTWIYRIATNEAITYMEKNKRRSTDSWEDAKGAGIKADEFFDGDQAQLLLKQAIALLPAKQRAVFNLRYYDQLPYSELSRITETSEGALKASYHHATKKIESYLKEHGG